MFGSKNDFIVNVPTNDVFTGAAGVEQQQRKCKSVWRWWNQLTKFQRSLAYMLVLVGLITVVYLFPANSNSPVLVDLERDDVLNMKRNDLVSSDRTIGVASGLAGVRERERDSAVGAVVEEPRAGAFVEPSGGEHEALEQPQEAVVEIRPTPVQFSGPINERQRAVVAAFQHAWRGYKQFAWGHDHLRPVSAQPHDWFGLGLTIVDSLDTMYIMGLDKEFEEAREWVRNKLTFDVNRDVNLFEVTIRILGGLLGAYHLSADVLFLQKAQDLADRLLPCFDSDSGVPYSDVNLATRKAHSPKWSPDSSTSEVTTIQLEFRDLSRSLKLSGGGPNEYELVASRVSEHVHGLEKQQGLVPIFINANTGQFRSYSTVTLGARGDSYYEYLLKQWLQTGRTLDYLRDDYLAAMQGVQERLARRTTGKHKLLFIGELLVGGKDFKPKMDHLTCYLPGTLALGVHNGLPRDHLRLAEDLLYTCYQTYVQQPTGLAPEITYFHISETDNESDMYVKTNDAHNLLRPELLESLWYMWQLTGNSTYQEWGWHIFEAFEKYTRVQNGYTSIGNVRAPDNTRPKDMMESFFLGETLKYLYLLFADDPKLLDLDRWVINTEAHPLPVRAS